MRISDWSSDVCSSDLNPLIIKNPFLFCPLDHLRDVDSTCNRHALVIPQRKQVSSCLVRFQPRRHVVKAPGDRCIVHPRARPRAQWATVLSGPLQSGEVPIGSSHQTRSEEHTSELQSLMRISYAVFCLKKKNKQTRK